MDATYMCVTTHRQGVSKLTYSSPLATCDNTHMPRQAFPIDKVRASLSRLMDEKDDKPKPLAGKLGFSETGVRDIFLPKTKSVGGPKLTKFAEHYGVTVEAIMDGTATTKGAQVPPSNAQPVKFEGASLERARPDMPVFGTALGAEIIVEGEAIEQTMLNQGEVVEYRKRPTIANGIERVYGLYVQGSSMYPAHRDGAFLFVQWDAPLRVGDDVVVYLRPQSEDDDGSAARAVLVKRLVRRTAQYVELEQYRPEKTFRIAMKEVLRIDRVLTNDDFA